MPTAIGCFTLAIIGFILARSLAKTVTKSIIDTQTIIKRFTEKISHNDESAMHELAQRIEESSNKSANEIILAMQNANKTPWIVKNAKTVIRCFAIIVCGLFYIGLIHPELAETGIPLLTCWLIIIICIGIFYAIEIHTFVAFPNFLNSTGIIDLKKQIHEIRIRMVIVSACWVFTITAAFATLLSLYGLK